MTPRPYRLGRRAESAEETLRRIVRATYTLHCEQGVAATTMKQIARRADVSVGTVYHHFPTYEDVVRACGRHVHELTRPPTLAIFASLRFLPGRIERLTSELFAYYERSPMFERVRCDQDKVPLLAQSVARQESDLAALVREALQPVGAPRRLVRMTRALTRFAVYRSLTEQGLSTRDAAAEIAEVILAWVNRVRSRPTPTHTSSTGG